MVAAMLASALLQGFAPVTQTAWNLLPHPDDDVAEILESRELLVLYSDNERLVVKVSPDPKRSTAWEIRGSPAYELRPDAVVAITYLK
jgi:hypothetical protein